MFAAAHSLTHLLTYSFTGLTILRSVWTICVVCFLLYYKIFRYTSDLFAANKTCAIQQTTTASATSTSTSSTSSNSARGKLSGDDKVMKAVLLLRWYPGEWIMMMMMMMIQWCSDTLMLIHWCILMMKWWLYALHSSVSSLLCHTTMNYMYSDHAVLVGRTHHQAHLPVLLHAKSLLGVCGTHRCPQPARLLEFSHLLGGQYLY